MKRILAVALLAVSVRASADQGSLANSGGSTAVGASIVVTSNVSTPAGALTLDCPVIAAGACAGGSFSYLSNDGTDTVSARFTSGTYKESCSGGGRGGHITCAYSFTGYLSGTWSVNGQTQAVVGVTSQRFGTGGAAATGTTAYNSAYTPFYYSDSEQIHRSDDLRGTNQISFGGQGGGVGQFYGAYGIALDSAGRIYVADTYNCRVVRIDDMTGSGWASFGTAGSGVGQLAPYLTSVAVDAGGRIYVADTGNKRLVRVDDMTGANWTVLTQSPPVNGISYYTFQSPTAVALDAAGRIYVADDESYAPAVIRVDDMTGANWTSIYTGGTGLHSIAVDSSGTVFTGGGGVDLVDEMAAVLTSSGAIAPLGSYYVFGVTPVPLPSPRPSAIGFSPSTLTFSQTVGTTSPPQTVTISSFGGSALNLWGISASGGFAETDDCPGVLPPGASCSVSVSFTPSAVGPADGLLSVSDDSGNAGAAQGLALTGSGTASCTVKGDVNRDGSLNVSDVFYLIDELFAGGPACLCSGDVNGDGTVDAGDVFYLLNYLFAGGPAPV